MRQLGQLSLLDAEANLLLIDVDADAAIRFARVRTSPKPGEATTLEDFIEREKTENSPPNAQRLFECMAKANYTIRNESTLASFYTQLDKVFNKRK